MEIIRVFPRRTNMTPTDEYSFVGDITMFASMIEADEVHISVTFTWDIEEGYRLKEEWSEYFPVVKIGGPAFGDRGGWFIPGRYIKNGVTFTSRGCFNRCPWCLVKTDLKLLDIKPGYIVQDDNLLQCPKPHIEQVFSMLRSQKRGIKFSGGLEAGLVDDYVVDLLKSVSIKEIYLAADSIASLKPLKKAVEKLPYLGRDKLRCYTLLGFNGETIEQAEDRLEQVWEIGCMPFAQLYQPPDKYIDYPIEWRRLSRTWSRPAAMRAMHRAKKGK